MFRPGTDLSGENFASRAARFRESPWKEVDYNSANLSVAFHQELQRIGIITDQSDEGVTVREVPSGNLVDAISATKSVIRRGGTSHGVRKLDKALEQDCRGPRILGE